MTPQNELVILPKTNRCAQTSAIQPSPEGRGWPATALSPAAAGRVRGHFIATPTQHNNTENSGNELHDLLQSNDLTTNVYIKTNCLRGTKRTAGWRTRIGRASQPHPRTNPSPVVLRLEKTPEPDTLSPRERAVASHGGNARDGERSADPASAGSACRAKARRYIRRGSGEGSLHCHTHPAQNTENSRNELNDLLQSKGLNYK